MKVAYFIKQVWDNRSMYRVFFDELVIKHCSDLNGRILDLASGASSYSKYLSKDIEVVRGDIGPGSDIVIDFNKELPFKDKSFDSVLFFNSIYIANDTSFTLKNIHRVLKDKGKLILAAPFIAPEFPEPHDWQRYTEEGLRRCLELAGFSDNEIYRFGGRFTSAYYLIAPILYFRIFKLFFGCMAIFCDSLVPKNLTKKHPAPLGYFCISRK